MKALAAGVLLALGAFAHGAGKPHSAYPERYSPPADAAQRRERCETYRGRLEHTRAWMGNDGVLARWNWIRTHHRKMERFVRAHCMQPAARGQDESDATGDRTAEAGR